MDKSYKNYWSLLFWCQFQYNRFYSKFNHIQLLLGYSSSCVFETDTCYTKQGLWKIIQRYVTCNLLIIILFYLAIPAYRYLQSHIFFQQYQIIKVLIYRMSGFQSLMYCLVVMKMIARIFSICLRCCAHFNGNISPDSPILLIARRFSHCCHVLLRV